MIPFQIDDRWASKVQREKFQFHNAQWLEIIQSQEQQSSRQSQGHLGRFDQDDDEDDEEEAYYDEEEEDDFERLVIRDPETLVLFYSWFVAKNPSAKVTSCNLF